MNGEAADFVLAKYLHRGTSGVVLVYDIVIGARLMSCVNELRKLRKHDHDAGSERVEFVACGSPVLARRSLNGLVASCDSVFGLAALLL